MTGWVPAEPAPLVGSVVWRIDLTRDPTDLARCDGVLSAEERDRADRFLRAQDRDCFRASHAALRLILGRTLSRPPAGIAFALGPRGKPRLADAACTGCDFNLSHSGGHALVGVSTEIRIGVDVEARRPMPGALSIARAHFAADEAAGLAARPEEARDATFLALWTCKEAVVKALGDGLSRPLDSFSVTLPPAPPSLLRIADGPVAWTLERLDLGPSAFGAAALPAAAVTIRHHLLPHDWTTRLR